MGLRWGTREGCFDVATVPHQPGALIWGGQLSGSVSNAF